MLKFFRHLRRDFLQKNRVAKYFLYAIGEIFLVVIGILIALQVNNWNENRKENLLEQNILKNLEQEFKENLFALNQSIDKRQIQIKALNALLAYIDSPEKALTKSHLDSLIGLSRLIPNFEARHGVLDDILSSGKLSVIKNASLRKILSNWSGELEDLTRRENGHENIILNQYNVHLIEHYSTRDSDNQIVKELFMNEGNMEDSWRIILNSKNDNQYQNIVSDKQFESIVSIVNMWAISGQLSAKNLKEKIIGVIDVINENIEE